MNAAMHIFMTLGFTVAERVLYVPSVGYCLVLGMILDRFIPNIKNDDNGIGGTEKTKTHSIKTSGSVVKDAKAAVSTDVKPISANGGRSMLSTLVLVGAIVLAVVYFDRYGSLHLSLICLQIISID